MDSALLRLRTGQVLNQKYQLLRTVAIFDANNVFYLCEGKDLQARASFVFLLLVCCSCALRALRLARVCGLTCRVHLRYSHLTLLCMLA